MKKPEAVLQFKVALEEIRPAVWRQFQIPAKAATFWSLHCAIQDVFGWLDCHLHEFRSASGDADLRIGIPDDDVPPQAEGILASWDTPLEPPFLAKELLYLYDFGDEWDHRVYFEGTFDRQPGLKYPICLAGQRACPPEDCGGVEGYANLLEAICDPGHPEHDDLLRWVGGAFDPEHFDPTALRFTNPKTRLRNAGLGAA